MFVWDEEWGRGEQGIRAKYHVRDGEKISPGMCASVFSAKKS